MTRQGFCQEVISRCVSWNHIPMWSWQVLLSRVGAHACLVIDCFLVIRLGSGFGCCSSCGGHRTIDPGIFHREKIFKDTEVATGS